MSESNSPRPLIVGSPVSSAHLAAAIALAHAHGVEVTFVKKPPTPPTDVATLAKAFTFKYQKTEVPFSPKRQRTYPKIPPRKL